MKEKTRTLIMRMVLPLVLAETLLINIVGLTITTTLAVVTLVIAGLLEFFLTKEYVSIGQLHETSTDLEKKQAVETSVEDKFINEILGYAQSLGLNVTLDMNGNALNLVDYIDDGDGCFVPICNMLFPDHNTKYGSDKYMATLSSMKEQIDLYLTERDKVRSITGIKEEDATSQS